MFTRDSLLLGGQWTTPSTDQFILVVSPTTEEAVGRIPQASTADVDLAVRRARSAHEGGDWRALSIQERGAHLERLLTALAPHLEDAIDTQIDEMGGVRKFIAAHSRGEASLQRLQGEVDLVASVPLSELRQVRGREVVVTRQPVGVCACIIPWNGPVGLILSRMLPPLLAGCPVVIKPALESPLSAYFVADAAVESGLPAGLLSIVAGGPQVGEYLVSHPDIARVRFTGSTAAGRRVGAICGEQLKPVSLELGGKSAALILNDADLDTDMPAIIGNALPNTGQVCFATTRLLAPSARYDEVVERLVDAVSKMTVGDPHLPETDFGPLVSSRQRDRVEGYIGAGKEAGATVAYGGGPAPTDRGWFVQPTIFSDVTNQMTIAQEEIFGPVLAIIRYDGQEEAISIANDSSYGLGGAVYTRDPERGLAVAERIESGSCLINDGVGGGGGGPFGGFKDSGLGRERGTEGVESYYEMKSISLPSSWSPQAP